MKKKINGSKRGPVKGIKLEQVSRTDFGQRLFAVRRSRKISQKELGEMVGVSLRMVSYYEREANGPPVALLKRMSTALGVTSSYLLGESPLKVVKDDLKPELRNYAEALQKLSRSDRKSILRMIDLAQRDGHATDSEDK